MTKVGMPGAKEGWQKTDVTMATVLKSQGYATGQFGKNHQGDRDEHLPTMHGFDEFLGSLYHLNAEEEPENRGLPEGHGAGQRQDLPAAVRPARRLKCKADGKGGQTIENTGPLTRSAWRPSMRKPSPRPRTSSPARPRPASPSSCWWNGTRMHFRTHVKPEHRGISGQDEYSDGMVEHDMHVGELLKLIDDLGLADNTIVQYSTDNGPHYNTWPDAGTTPFRSEKNSNWEGAFRVLLRPLARPFPRPRRRSTASCRTKTGCRPSRRRRRAGHQGEAAQGRRTQRPHLQEPPRRLQPARLPQRQGQGIAAQ
jgi:arylsulfatase A-like enzyme